MLDLYPVVKRRTGRPPRLQHEKTTARMLACARYRSVCNASIEEAAEAFGVDRSTVCRWERVLKGLKP